MNSGRLLDLIRFGTYAQLEGSFHMPVSKPEYRFRFETNQIKDMRQLVSRVSGKQEFHTSRLSVSSKDVYDEIISLGFRRFNKDNWNIPNLNSFGETGRKEYIRAVIDSIGNVDAEEQTPNIQISSVNIDSIKKLSEMFDGSLRGPYNERTVYVRWRGRKALTLLDYLDWEFNNYRNERGAALISAVRWSDYLI